MLKNLSISLKLYLVVAIALGALAVFGATTYSTVRLVMVNGPVYARIVQGKDLVADILPPPAYILESKLTLLELLNAKDDAQRTPLLERMTKLEKEYGERHEYWSANLAEGAMKETLLSDAHKPAIEFYKAFSEQFKPLVLAGKHDEAQALAEGRLEQLYVAHRAAIDKVVELAGKFSSENEASAAAITGQRSLLLVGVALGSAAITLVLAALIIRAITRPLGRVIEALRLIAANNLSVPPLAMDGKDEVAQLGRAADAMAASLKSMVGEVVSITHQVAAAATEVAASAEEMAHGMKQQQGQTQQVSAAIEEMSCSVVEVAKKSSDAAAAASNSGKQAEHGGDVVARTVTEMKGIATQVTESAKAVGSLGHKSEEIGQIIGVINDIADQTNLLALNAAIEAARAGEHGRGFAVVADEVRKLAERTTQATKEVASSIREIQDETKSAVERIDGGAKQVATGVELAGSAGEALQKIVAGSLSVQQMVQSIAAAAEEQSSASAQIAKSIEAISAVTLESTEGANQAAMAAAQLSERAESLQKLVSRFKV